MNRKGFTLAEVLAVIVFIAVVSIITAPIILDLLEESRQNAAVDNAYGYVDGIRKYYETLSYDTGDVISLEGKYDIVDGKLSGLYADELDVPVTGSVPINGKLVYEDDKLVSGCLTFNEYRVGYINGSFDIYGKGSCRINGDFVNDSWSQMAYNYSIDNNAYDNEIGKTRNLSFTYNGNNYTVTLRLLNTSTPAECYVDGFSQTACGLVVGFESLAFGDNITDIWMVSGGWYNTTNSGGWRVSPLRSQLNTSVDGNGNPNSLYSSFPAELRNVIIPTSPIVSGSGSDDSSNDVVSSTDYLYIPSAIEVGIDDVRDSKKNQTRILDYYVTHNTAADRIKSNYEGAKTWWLRTANHNSETDYLAIFSDGTIGSTLCTGFGERPFASVTFRIGVK